MLAAAVKERPILFSGPMVRAILDGRKTMTRRMVKPQPIEVVEGDGDSLLTFPENLRRFDGERSCMVSLSNMPLFCPYGRVGDRLWVREAWLPFRYDHIIGGKRYAYRADSTGDSESDRCRQELGYKWKPSIHMPRAASRLTLEITDVRVERLQDITLADIAAEGVQIPSTSSGMILRVSGKFPPSDYLPKGFDLNAPIDEARAEVVARAHFASLWESINGAGSWAANPWVWVVSFRRLEAA